jgi:hypothetical protein
MGSWKLRPSTTKAMGGDRDPRPRARSVDSPGCVQCCEEIELLSIQAERGAREQVSFGYNLRAVY